MERRLFLLLNRAQHALKSYVDAEALKETGLTSAQMSVLLYLAKHDGCLLKELGEGLGLKNAAMTGLVARTESTGCCRRRESPEDGRATQVFLTPKGRATLAKVARLNDDLNRLLREGYSDEDIDLVLRFLNDVLRKSRSATSEASTGTESARRRPRHLGG
ncbi:MAG TPA: MarR family transcriptional regulator [Labilithrix sp.]|nr:MarR family transcriptional regulator [Labilithrix sp.]